MFILQELKVVAWTHIPNYGDFLGPYIINKLSGILVKEKGATLNWYGCFVSILSRLKRFRSNPFSQPVKPCEKNLIMSVGSILKFANSSTTVWGSGFISNSDKIKDVEKICAVRGFKTKSLLEKQRILFGDIAVGDPALLLPLILQGNSATHKVALIPHFVDYRSVKESFNDFFVVDLNSSDIEKITRDITSCEVAFSTSLHGLIVCHAYGIPCIWVKNEKLEGGNFKFHDYFSSVDLPLYDAFDINELRMKSEIELKKFVEDRISLALPLKEKITEIQKNLLKKAPFPILSQYLL